MSVYIAAVGDANDHRTYSGTPFYCLSAGRSAGVIDAGLALSTTGARWALRRAGWNILELFRAGDYGGYQFTDEFLSRLYSQAPELHPDDIILNCFPLYPEHIRRERRIRKWFFLDQTLTQLFEYYGTGNSVSQRVKAAALLRERSNYQSAEVIITNSEWAAASVVEDYNIPRDKVYVVLQGANFEVDAYDRWAAAHIPRTSMARGLSLVFVGKYWSRKGLDRLLAAVRLAVMQDAAINLTIIGYPRNEAPSEYQNIPQVRWLGALDKRRDAERFMSEVANHDVGCLLSRQEAGGIALREYHSLGLAVLGPDTGGAVEQVLDGAAILVRPDMGNIQIANILVDLARAPERVLAMKRMAWERRRDCLWSHAVEAIAQILRLADQQRSRIA